jgi:hypothetical protein
VVHDVMKNQVRRAEQRLRLSWMPNVTETCALLHELQALGEVTSMCPRRR